MNQSTITPSELKHLLGSDAEVHLIDVRSGSEFESAHIPGSYHVPLETLAEHSDELTRHIEQPVVLICQSGGRATQACEHLADAGLPNVRVLQGGLGSWLATGGEVRQGEQKWGIERQVRLVAGSLVVAGALGSLYAKPAVALAGFVGAGLTFSALTNTCGMAAVLSRLPYNKGAACDVRDVIAQMSTSTTRPAATAAAS